ncbi:TraB/GumN family protein [Carnobacterium gallinarum]|uniref:TraB/GumN family protein n=1 Tax=Carnobacterium gallinarum TaxID=2749 RepID=UPI00054F8921|nr:TraB/GumN family protein [Carnobacterium gallinarum]
MKKIIYIVSFLIIFATGCASGNNEKKSIKVDWPLYEISYEDSTVGYLLGTSHIGKPSMYPFPDKLKEAIDLSDIFFSEVNYNQAYSESTSNILETFSTNGPRLDSQLTDVQQQALEKKLKNYDINSSLIENTTIFGLYIQMQNKYLDSIDVLNGVDYQLNNYLNSKKQKIENVGFETVTEQYELIKTELYTFQSANTDWPDKFPDLSQAKQTNQKMLTAYISGQLETAMIEINDDPIFSSENFIVERTQKWMPKIDDALKNKENIFIAVGSAHLYKTQGIIELLKQKGYTITKINFD